MKKMNVYLSEWETKSMMYMHKKSVIAMVGHARYGFEAQSWFLLGECW